MAGSPDVLAGTFAGRYTIERELGSGATATVYLARDTQRGMSVAVKLLRHELSQSVGAERFLREIRLNERLHHPHIVPVLDSGEHEGRLYFVLPHMEEGSLRQLLQREKQLPIERAIEITKTIAQALDYAHQQKLIHRDVKPENILFTAGQACLADFGIARAVERAIDESTTDTGLVRGTPAYMSPEQASGSKDYDGRSDQYSLACVLYEMLAGVPAFIGPTPEAIIAQRFQHLPRELRVYRPSAPAAIDDVLVRALAMSPADRYASTADFATALDSAFRTTTVERLPSATRVGLTRWRRMTLGGAAVLASVTAAYAVVAGDRRLDWTNRPTLDTTRVVVLPFGASDASNPIPHDQLLHEALSRWEGVTLVDRFQVADAIARRGAPPRSIEDGNEIAGLLGAGRLVRADITMLGDSLRLSVALMDVASGRALHSVSGKVGMGRVTSDSVYARIAEELLIRPGNAAAPAAIVPASRSVPARQAFARGMEALNGWDLAETDSLLEAALTFDPAYAGAALWLAQVRSWQLRSSREWLSLAERAMHGTGVLSDRERQLGSALLKLGSRDFVGACEHYGRMRDANPQDFAAWFGLGRCSVDDAVVRDSLSPTGWRFRTSYVRAITAYATALRLMPISYRSLQRGAFEPLRAMLYTDEDRLRFGVAVPPDSGQFLARMVASGDSVAFLPVPIGQPLDSLIDRTAFMQALQQQRVLFRDIAGSWSAALPTSAGAKEAVAVALELLGDPTALDTIRLARRLAISRPHRLRLASIEIAMTAKLALPLDTVAMWSARRLADSILADRTSPSDEEASYLAPVAALRGECDRTIALTRQASTMGDIVVTMPRFVVAESNALLVAVVLGCQAPNLRSAISTLASRLPAPPAAQREFARMTTRQLARAAFPLDSQLIVTAAHAGDPLLLAEQAVVSNQPATARALLGNIQARRWAVQNGGTPDSFLAEAKLWLQLGDTAAARAHLDSGFALLRRQPPISFAAVGITAARAASLARALSLRAALERPQDSRLWSAAARALPSPRH